MRLRRAILGGITVGLQLHPAILWAQSKAPRTLIERLDPQTRGSVILALAALIMLGFLLIAITWLGFRVIRRWHRDAALLSASRRAPRANEHDWASKPIRSDDAG